VRKQAEHTPHHAHVKVQNTLGVLFPVPEESNRHLRDDEQADVVGDADGAGKVVAVAQLEDVVPVVDLADDEEHRADGHRVRPGGHIAAGQIAVQQEVEGRVGTDAEEAELDAGADVEVDEGAAASLSSRLLELGPDLGVNDAEEGPLEGVGKEDDAQQASDEDEGASCDEVGEGLVRDPRYHRRHVEIWIWGEGCGLQGWARELLLTEGGMRRQKERKCGFPDGRARISTYSPATLPKGMACGRPGRC
jgi:hypothetical protein